MSAAFLLRTPSHHSPPRGREASQMRASSRGDFAADRTAAADTTVAKRLRLRSDVSSPISSPSQHFSSQQTIESFGTVAAAKKGISSHPQRHRRQDAIASFGYHQQQQQWAMPASATVGWAAGPMRVTVGVAPTHPQCASPPCNGFPSSSHIYMSSHISSQASGLTLVDPHHSHVLTVRVGAGAGVGVGGGVGAVHTFAQNASSRPLSFMQHQLRGGESAVASAQLPRNPQSQQQQQRQQNRLIRTPKPFDAATASRRSQAATPFAAEGTPSQHGVDADPFTAGSTTYCTAAAGTLTVGPTPATAARGHAIAARCEEEGNSSGVRQQTSHLAASSAEVLQTRPSLRDAVGGGAADSPLAPRVLNMDDDVDDDFVDGDGDRDGAHHHQQLQQQHHSSVISTSVNLKPRTALHLQRQMLGPMGMGPGPSAESAAAALAAARDTAQELAGILTDLCAFSPQAKAFVEARLDLLALRGVAATGVPPPLSSSFPSLGFRGSSGADANGYGAATAAGVTCNVPPHPSELVASVTSCPAAIASRMAASRRGGGGAVVAAATCPTASSGSGPTSPPSLAASPPLTSANRPFFACSKKVSVSGSDESGLALRRHHPCLRAYGSCRGPFRLPLSSPARDGVPAVAAGCGRGGRWRRRQQRLPVGP